MHAQPFHLAILQIIAIAGIVLAALLLIVSPSRRWLVNLYMQFTGWLDARLLRKHHTDLVVKAVSRRISRITGQTASAFARWLQRVRAWFGWLGTAYNRALTEWENVQQRIAQEETKAAARRTGDAVLEMPQFMPLGPTAYWIVQFVLGLGECALTYTAFQSWHLSPALMIFVVVGSGLLGAALGHLCGQAVYHRSAGAVRWIGLACGLYCLVLGVMRFNWLAHNDAAGGATFGNFLGAFGWPILCVGASIIIGSQLRYLTALEQAKADEARAKHRCEALNERGKSAQKALRDRMHARAALKTTAVDSFHRGFAFGWIADPITFPEQPIVIPEAEIDALWPPVRWTPQLRAAPPPALPVTENGSPSHELAVR